LTKRPNNISILRKNLSLSDIKSLGLNLYNDLEPVVIQRFPEVQIVKDELRAWGALGVLLSGSGSAVFGIFDDPEKARAAYEGLNGDWERVISETIESFAEFFPEEILNYP
jgi:4-diphosphocytidyl-2-C-methyl-D-erythritol kinase